MYNGIAIIMEEITNTEFSGIEVNSEILSEADESNNASIVKGIGRSLVCHLFIGNKNIKKWVEHQEHQIK